MMSGISLIATITYTAWMFLGTPQDLSLPSMSGTTDPAVIRYVAIGDSYTVGEGVAVREAWPSQLVEIAKANGVQLKLVASIARSGWTTTDLIGQGLPEYDATNAQFVTLMIGTNDAQQNMVPEHFQSNFRIILDKITQQVPPEKIVVITIPDYLVTPTGAQKASGANPEAEIRSLNSVIQNECAERGCEVVDIFEVSRHLGSTSSLMTRDKLHPSPTGHLEWANVIAPTVLRVLGK